MFEFLELPPSDRNELSARRRRLCAAANFSRPICFERLWLEFGALVTRESATTGLPRMAEIEEPAAAHSRPSDLFGVG
jgi:hypothetical protein